MVFKKCRETPDNILFIDASRDYGNISSQNYLRPVDIDDINKNYRERIIEARFSNLAELEKLKDNDYNLNIPRYVTTFEIEDKVDINVVSIALKEVDNKLKETDKQIKKYCQELNIPTPF